MNVKNLKIKKPNNHFVMNFKVSKEYGQDRMGRV